MIRKRTIALSALVIVTATIVLAHEGHVALPTRGAQVDTEKGTIVLSRESREALDVRSVEIASGGLPEAISTYATLAAPWGKRAYASSRLPGRIARLPIKPGEKVAAGQVLAEVASLELESLQLEILTLQTDVSLARQVQDNLKKSIGSVPEIDIRDAANKVAQLENSILVSRIKWIDLGLPANVFEQLLNTAERAEITFPVLAPIGGTVVHADLLVGKIVDPAEHLFEIVDLTQVWAEIGILERDLSHIAPNQVVELTLTAYPGEVFSGTIRSVDQTLDVKNGMATAWAEFMNSTSVEPRLLPGMTGKVRVFRPSKATDTRTVPSEAVIDDGVSQYVLVEEASAEKQSEYRRRTVVIVRQSGSQTEIRSSELLPGDRVVSRGAHELGGFFPPGVLRLSPESKLTIGLKLAPAESMSVETVVTLEGSIDLPPDRRGQASTNFSGALTTLAVERGQSVTAGQVVATVASLEFQNLQLDYLRERLMISLYESQVQSLRVAPETIARRRLLDAEALLAGTKAKAESHQARLTLVGLTAQQIESITSQRKILTSLPVRAPVGGVVVALMKSLGQQLKTEEPILEIHDVSRPLVQVFVPEAAVRRIQIGQSARVRFISDSDNVHFGKVVRSARVLTAADQALSVWIEISVPQKPVRQNQLARVAIVTDSGVPTLAVPLSAIVREGTQSFVFIEKSDGTFDRVKVAIGRRNDSKIEIRSGIKSGDWIAIAGTAGLQTAYASIR